MGDFDAAASLLDGLLNTPQQFIRSDVVVFGQCSKALKLFFACGKQSPIKGGPLTELLVDGFDSEQVWQQIELENQPVLLHIESQLKLLESAEGEEEVEEDDGGEGDEVSDEGDELLGLADEGDEGLQADEGDEGDLEEEDMELPVSQKRGFEGQEEQASKKFKADRDPALGGNILKFDDESSGEDEGDPDRDAEFTKGGEAGDEPLDGDDPFFNMEEMNRFADEGMEPSEQDEGDGEGDEEEEEEDNGKGMKYKDFFDAPLPKASANEDDSLLSSFQRQERDMKKRISAMEDELIQPRPWTLAGEVPSSARPSESLLQEDLDFEYATRPTEGLTEEGSMKLEDIIRGRIVDGLFDDVERKRAPKKKAFKPVEEVSTAKSEVGLAEVYEKEFLELAKGEDEPTAAEAKLNKEHQEIAVLFAQLCHKLDSLSDFSFTPKPPSEEVTVVTSAPAISMEEVIPMGVSSGTLIAPEEEFKSKSTGKPVGASELEQKEKRTRRGRKKRLHAARAETRAREKGPDKKAEKKEIESVLHQRHVKEGVLDTTKYGTSKEVFAKLTQTTENDPFARKKKKAPPASKPQDE